MTNSTPPVPDTELNRLISHNVATVREKIARAAVTGGRNPKDVRLIGVCKKFPETYARAAAAAGITDLGENRVQEALEKISQTTDLVNVTWHLVGHLQSNKARRAVSAMTWIHSVDSVLILERLERAASEQGITVHLLVQVNLAGEATKHGAMPDEVRWILETAGRCQAVRTRGLMILPPWSKNPEDARPYFCRLRELRDRLIDEGIDREMLGELSMGMSNDFEVAIEEGATMVRIGTALFGQRPQLQSQV